MEGKGSICDKEIYTSIESNRNELYALNFQLIFRINIILDELKSLNKLLNYVRFTHLRLLMNNTLITQNNAK